MADAEPEAGFDPLPRARLALLAAFELGIGAAVLFFPRVQQFDLYLLAAGLNAFLTAAFFGTYLGKSSARGVVFHGQRQTFPPALTLPRTALRKQRRRQWQQAFAATLVATSLSAAVVMLDPADDIGPVLLFIAVVAGGQALLLRAGASFFAKLAYSRVTERSGDPFSF